jgi:ABC-type glutathione transport system ATPase component
MLSIKNLSATVGDKPILKGLTLDIPAGEVHAVMGPNGAGKSTLSYVLTGKPGYEVTGGSVTLDGEDLLALDPAERAAKGVFLSFQYPMEIPGVPALTFLRTALNAQRKARGEAEVSAPAFLKLIREKSAELKIDFEMLKRALNVGFSGGEKKRMCWRPAGSSPPAVPNWRWTSRRPATTAMRGLRLEPDERHQVPRRQPAAQPARRSLAVDRPARPAARAAACFVAG